MINKLYILYIHCLIISSNYNHPPPPSHSSASYVRTTGQIPAGAPATGLFAKLQ